MANELMEQRKRGAVSLAELRTKASNAFVAAVDSQGRITIDRELRAFAGIELGSPVMVSGAFDRVEVWHPETFARWKTPRATRPSRAPADPSRTSGDRRTPIPHTDHTATQAFARHRTQRSRPEQHDQHNEASTTRKEGRGHERVRNDPGRASLICSLPVGKMDSPNSARFRLASRGDIPAATAGRGAADERAIPPAGMR